MIDAPTLHVQQPHVADLHLRQMKRIAGVGDSRALATSTIHACDLYRKYCAVGRHLRQSGNDELLPTCMSSEIM